MQRFLFLFALLFSTGTSFTIAQSPYHLDLKKEGVITAFGVTTMTSSYFIDKETPIYSSTQLADLSRTSINFFDRTATYNYSSSAQKTSDVLSLGSKFLPLVLLLDKNQRSDFGTIAALYAETYLISNGLTSLTKTSIRRTRPFVYNEDVAIDHKLTSSARYSFVSGHTSKTAAMTFFTAKVYADYHPDSKWKPVVWTAAAVVPAVTGYMRVKAGKHYPTDVIAGYAIGAATGILVPQLHKKKIIKNDNLKISAGITGANLSLTF